MADALRTVGFTGHRTERFVKAYGGGADGLRACRAARDALSKRVWALADEGYARFICGMCYGADYWFAEAVIAAQEVFPEISLEAAIPFPQQSARFARADRVRYDALLRACGVVRVLSPVYVPECYAMRNHYIVDQCGLLLAAYVGGDGGTAQTLRYAARRGIPIEYITITAVPDTCGDEGTACVRPRAAEGAEHQ